VVKDERKEEHKVKRNSFSWLDLLYSLVFLATLTAMTLACNQAGQTVREALNNVTDVKLEDININ
jgi:hypothetical protein